ncbi:hypothetical protein ACPC54_19515 [Kitasatospora sp. NPDC094028]
MAATDRAARDRKAFEERLKTAAHAGLKGARRYTESWWDRLHEERLTAHNVRMDGFFENITGHQVRAKLWEDLTKALDASADPAATWQEKIAEAERVGAFITGGTMGNPVADARHHVQRVAHADFARDAAYSFRCVS